MIFLPNLVSSNLHKLYICYVETVNLLYKDHKVSVWHYHYSENPYHPSTATGLPIGRPRQLTVEVQAWLELQGVMVRSCWESRHGSGITAGSWWRLSIPAGQLAGIAQACCCGGMIRKYRKIWKTPENLDFWISGRF